VLSIDREFSSKDLRSVGNYTLGTLIGKGSFGRVYLATHKLTNGSKVRGFGKFNLEEKGAITLR
jgi:serine/threonine protein kinase